MFSKVLVANRAEIAVRAFRAAYEIGSRTVAVFPQEDRNSEHRLKADEAYQIGEPGSPVKAYLNIDEIVRVALKSGADAVYPGYGFLSENPDLARGCRDNGLTFIGPPAEVLELAGNKVAALKAAKQAGIPTLKSSDPSTDVEYLLAEAEKIGFPIFAKAVAGGGGRGMRRVDDPLQLRDALEAAMREAESAFGDATMFLEQAVLRPRHIEVQILADSQGNIVHLHERDCSVQRRHQKVIEIAPAPNLDPQIKAALCADAVKFAQAIGYQNAGTVEFLVDTAGDRAGQHVFIEMNPRIQVEHTVTEEVTDIDLVSAQMRIASGESLADLGIAQETIHVNGFALQSRITTEDPANGFRPDTGRIVAYRSPGGAGVRLDGATATAGSHITGHFDSMLVKLTCRGRDFDTAVRRARRALAEFRIRGIRTNIPFLQAVLSDSQFAAGQLATSFIDDRPELLEARESGDRGTKLLNFLGDVTVNRPYGASFGAIEPKGKLPLTGPLSDDVPAGSRQFLLERGPVEFARALREQTALAVTDTTFRDAHQSLLATRVRTRDLLLAAPQVARLTPQLFSVEAWGGATYDVALRFLGEDPWDRLDKLRKAMPNVCIQMLLRGRNTVGYTPYPTEVTDAFVKEAAASGVDIFRIFDALNDVEQMRPAIDAVRATGTAVAEVALCYTGNLLDPDEQIYTLDYYLELAQRIVDAGAHILAIKDMAGLLRPSAARILVSALRERFDVPVHLHTHDTTGGQMATLLAASEAGVDVVDVASAAMAGTTSQPSMSALVAALEHTERDTGLSLQNVCDLEPYWEAMRTLYRPFENGLRGPTGRVYRHEIPGGQLSNLRQQASALGLSDHFEAIEDTYAAADRMLGRLVKVTPSSKVVGDLALQLVAQKVDPTAFAADPAAFDIPDSVVSFLDGELGNPPAGWPEPFRTKALAGRSICRANHELTPQDSQELWGSSESRRNRLNHLLFAGPTKDYENVQAQYGDVSVLPTSSYLYGLETDQEVEIRLDKGVRIIVGLEAVGEPDAQGMRTVMFTLNGQLRPIQVRDSSVEITQSQAEKADDRVPGHVGAPYSGSVTVLVQEGQAVEAGTVIATIEAMKMEASITAPVAGTVNRLPVGIVSQVSGGDLIAVIG